MLGWQRPGRLSFAENMGQELPGIIDNEPERQCSPFTAGQAQVHAKSWHGLAVPNRPGRPAGGSANVSTHSL
jgi:hypothetical protein